MTQYEYHWSGYNALNVKGKEGWKVVPGVSKHVYGVNSDWTELLMEREIVDSETTTEGP